MTTTMVDDDVVRRPADWMRPMDDRILELLADEGNLSPKAMELGDITSDADEASRRCTKLVKAGFLDRPFDAPGLYRLTQQGIRYLNGEFDATDLPDPDASGRRG